MKRLGQTVVASLISACIYAIVAEAQLPAGGGGGGGGGAVTGAAGSFLDCWNVTEGCKTDARSTATDATSISAMQVEKEISFAGQAAASSLATLVANSVTLGQAVRSASLPVTTPSAQPTITIIPLPT